jgi:hypothetical protein
LEGTTSSGRVEVSSVVKERLKTRGRVAPADLVAREGIKAGGRVVAASCVG